MAYESDPLRVLQNEILKTRDAKLNPKPNRKYRFKLDDEYINDNSDQDFINEYVSMSEFFPEKN